MDFLKLLESGRVVVFDGGMGTQLAQRGAPSGGAANIEAPDAVTAVHRAYVDAGANVIITNTFCMNKPYIEKQRIGREVGEINRAGVALARRAAGDGVAVLGDIGPTGLMLPPVGGATVAEMHEALLEQARALADAGVDGFIVETMIDVNEAAAAVRACVENFRLPVVASMTYATAKGGGRTTMGHRAADCAAALEAAGAAVLGSNCGDLDPAETAVVVEAYLSASKLPVLVEPNAGKPRVGADGGTVYDMAPGDFAEGVLKCVAAGARLAGGCCGTTPEHIRALAAAVRDSGKTKTKT